MRISSIKFNSNVKNNINFKAISINPSYRSDDVEKPKARMASEKIESARKSLDTIRPTEEFDKVRTGLSASWIMPCDSSESVLLKPEHSSDYWPTIVNEVESKSTIIEKQDACLKTIREKSEHANQTLWLTRKDIERLDAERKQDGVDLSSIPSFAPLRKNKGFKQLAGYDREKEILNRYFVSQILNRKDGEEAKVPGAILFFGPQGNGKTTFATAFAQEIGCEEPIEFYVSVKDSSGVKKYVEKLEEACQEAEKTYRETGNIQVILLDEIDDIKMGDKASLDKFGKILRDAYKKYHTVIFATTNYPLDITLPITGEDTVFPYVVSVDPPSRENKKEILKYYLEGRCDGKLSESDYEKITERLEEKERKTGSRYSVAQIKDKICKDDKNKAITLDKILENIENTKCYPNITQSQISEYYTAMERLMKDKIE